MAPKNNTADGRASGAGGWRAALSRPLWVVSAGAGIGLALGLTGWAGTAFASGPGTAAPSDATIADGAGNLATGFAATANGGIANTVSGFYATASGGSSNRVPGEAASVSGGRGNLALGNSASVSGGLDNAARGTNDAILGGANEVIGTPIRCGFFPVSPAMSHS
jgi:hypothetical protein